MLRSIQVVIDRNKSVSRRLVKLPNANYAFDEVVLLSSAVIGVSLCTGAVGSVIHGVGSAIMERESVVCLVVRPSTVSYSKNSDCHEASCSMPQQAPTPDQSMRKTSFTGGNSF